MELTDNTITLKPFELKDANTHLAGDDAEQQKWISGGKSTLKTIEGWIKKNQEYWNSNGPVFNFAIWDMKDSELVGMIEANTDFTKVEGIRKGDANISYGLYPKARGKGYIIKAVALVEKFLKEKGSRRAVMRINKENASSLKVPSRCGYKEVGKITTKDKEELIIFTKNL
jgi:RimJ/RimL family protein N-acetyltransferase